VLIGKFGAKIKNYTTVAELPVEILKEIVKENVRETIPVFGLDVPAVFIGRTAIAFCVDNEVFAMFRAFKKG